MRSSGIVLATASLLTLAGTAPRAGWAAPYDIDFFFPPIYAGATAAVGINDQGDIAGYTNYTPQTFPHAYIRNADGSFVNFDVPGAKLTAAAGINNAGVVAGISLNQSFQGSGFLRQPDGSLSSFSNGFGLQVNGLNDLGQVVGSVDTPGGTLGYVKTGNSFATFKAPPADGNFPQTFAYGLNNDGDVVGQFFQGNTRRSFLMTSGGGFSYLDLAGAEVSAYGINDADDIVGSLKDGTGIHGFLLRGGVYTLFDALNPLATSWLDLGFTTRGATIFDINNNGVMVGTAVDGRTTDPYNFILTPIGGSARVVPEPAALPLLALLLSTLAVARWRRQRTANGAL